MEKFNIKDYCKVKGIKQGQIAKDIGLSQSHFSEICSNKKRLSYPCRKLLSYMHPELDTDFSNKVSEAYNITPMKALDRAQLAILGVNYEPFLNWYLDKDHNNQVHSIDDFEYWLENYKDYFTKASKTYKSINAIYKALVKYECQLFVAYEI